MKKISVVFLFLFYCISNIFSQTENRGVKPLDDKQSFSGSTKLIVVGVSKYQNVQSLKYAHTDAQAFYNYMTSKEGGNIDEINTRLLLNEKATAANIFTTLNWLIDETKEGENIIFYFAGHGDLENKTMFQNGFLLANDAPTAAYMAGGTIGVTYLQQYLTTLVSKNKARVILITDACHSGKLAGGLEGVANTATALQGNWENTIKILSSQPGELSQEGTQWNGGGGVFTYYLVKGLMGFADRNHDNKITVNEINIYLNDHIPAETNFTQNPSVIGNSSTVIAKIDSIAFAKIANKEKDIKLSNTSVAMRGNEDDIKTKMDTATYNTYLKFKYCIDANYLSGNHPGYGNAVDLYNKLKDSKKAEIIILSAKRSLIAALQNPAQILVNRIITGKGPSADTIPFDEVYFGIETAFFLADSTEINFNNIKARYLFIKASAALSNPNKEEVIKLLNEVIKVDPDFAPAIYMLGEIMLRKNRNEEALKYFQKAIELCPKWSFANNSIAQCYAELKQYDKAIEHYLKNINQEPENYNLYYNLSYTYSLNKNKVDALKYLEISLQKGFNNFDHLEKDTDLDFIRNTKEFKDMIIKYQKK